MTETVEVQRWALYVLLVLAGGGTVAWIRAITEFIPARSQPMRRAGWWQRRKARHADEVLLEDVAFREAFLGLIDPATGRRPVDASIIVAGQLDANTLRIDNTERAP